MNLWLRFIWQMLFSSKEIVAKVFDEVRTPFRVLPIDIDPNMHMNNGVYLSIMDLARFDMSFKNGLMSMMKDNKIYPVVASQTIRYRRSLGLFQKYDVATKILGWDERFFFIQQKFMVGDDTYALALVKGRFLRKSGGGVDPSEAMTLSGLKFEKVPELPSWATQWVRSEETSWQENIPKV